MSLFGVVGNNVYSGLADKDILQTAAFKIFLFQDLGVG